MSFAGAEKILEMLQDPEGFMAKQEIVKRTANIFRTWQWRWWLKKEISIKWPHGWTPQDHLGNSSQTSDPNEWYRAWLEQYVGRQGWDWDWRVGDRIFEGDNWGALKIKFRRESDAVLFTLKYK